MKSEIEIHISIKECHMKADVTLTITINAAEGLTVDASGVPTSGAVGQPFSGQLKVSGGTGPFTFALTAGALPDGVSLLSDGSFSGTPTAAGTFNPTITVTDSQG
jgi:hypothetical protein